MFSEHPRRESASFLSVDRHEFTSENPAHLALREQFRAQAASRAPQRTNFRFIAAGALGVTLGLGGTVVAVNMVQANDRLDMYETVRSDNAARRLWSAPRPQSAPIYTAHTTISYAPVRTTTHQPLTVTNVQGQIVIPGFNLNPFLPTGAEPGAPRPRRDGQAKQNSALFSGSGLSDTVSGASDHARTICVRLCDGYHHPIGNLRDQRDMNAHTALCTAMFPGVPTRVFRVAGGARTIDDAVGPDGRTYRSLPMSYAYQRSIDPACARPRNGDTTISLMRDFTLRPGDAVILNGRVRVFSGANQYPFNNADFTGFRNSTLIGNQTKRSLDQIVGVTRQERLEREARAMLRQQEANATAPNTAMDVVRGAPAIERSQVRVIELPRR